MVPQLETLEEYLASIEEIPLFTNPNVFGLHTNAEIIYFTNYAKNLWFELLKMSTSDGGAEGGGDKDSYIREVASEIQNKLPEVFDVYNIKKKFDVPSPTQVVLLQELDHFNNLLTRMNKTLSDLKKALDGVIGMSQELESLSTSMFNGYVPASWLKLAPMSLKNLVSWIEHFHNRHAQYKEWDEVAEPKVMWLSGLHTPESYLTALI